MSMTDFANMSTRHYVRDINTLGFTNLIWCLFCSDCLPLWSDDWDEFYTNKVGKVAAK